MEREILFRGKRIDNGEWVEGHYVQREPLSKPLIVTQTLGVIKNKEGNNMRATASEVAPGTVGQFTGLLDKNGNRIFEGDIVRRFNSRGQEVMRYAVKWNTDCCMFVLMCEDTYLGEYDSDFTVFYGEELEIIGNVHDNPEFPKYETPSENDKKLVGGNRELKRLLKLAIEDFDYSMNIGKCNICGNSCCEATTICKWRYKDEAEKLLKGDTVEAVADVQAVKHGKWRFSGNYSPTKNWICSECNGMVIMPEYCWESYYNYCPNCGAKMDGE